MIDPWAHHIKYPIEVWIREHPAGGQVVPINKVRWVIARPFVRGRDFYFCTVGKYSGRVHRSWLYYSEEEALFSFVCGLAGNQGDEVPISEW